jgi:biopolymer transport protein ExbB/TolQ
MREVVSWLTTPVVIMLMLLLALSIWETGATLGERFGGLARLRRGGDVARAMRMGRRRIERADVIARIGPMLGLMGTLVSLGPGLAGLGRGELGLLSSALAVAFDTTVLGLLAGIVGYVIGRLRRRWYDQLIAQMEVANG